MDNSWHTSCSSTSESCDYSATVCCCSCNAAITWIQAALTCWMPFLILTNSVKVHRYMY